MLTCTHACVQAEVINTHYKHIHKYTPVHMHTRRHTQARVPDPNPDTHTFLIPHNCFQSKGSCLSGPRRGLIARYKILRREGKAAGEREGERAGERGRDVPPRMSLHSLSLFLLSCCTCAQIWCLLKWLKKNRPCVKSILQILEENICLKDIRGLSNTERLDYRDNVLLGHFS